ncbi:hypothetical protein CBER1_05771 [Cercospora berteroae]|uniref:Uncharacterized protein n=1 Tax=Cercospora berteroae TaxID=357750 RepID=A0A2S6CI09_9PEZI|nr:hypothetical protein CBER1_05771 [Cercospora berteroae]
MADPQRHQCPGLDESAPAWAKKLFTDSERRMQDEENAIYLVCTISLSHLFITDHHQLEMTFPPSGYAAATRVIDGLQQHFVIWNFPNKSHVAATSQEIKLGWLVAVPMNSAIPHTPELDSKEIKITKVRKGVRPEAERVGNENESGYETDHEMGAEAAADAGPAFQMNDMDVQGS